MRATAALALIGLMTAGALPGCRTFGGAPANGTTLPQVVALPTPAGCALGEAPAMEGSDLGLVERLRDGQTDPARDVTTALLAGSLSNNAGDWERAYAFCALVPTTAGTNQRLEAAVCQNKAAINMGPARTACADVLASQWIAERSRVGLGFAAPAEPAETQVPTEPQSHPEEA